MDFFIVNSLAFMSQSDVLEKHRCLREQSISSKNIMKIFHFVMLIKKGKKHVYFLSTTHY